jgi:hypothetical protein
MARRTVTTARPVCAVSGDRGQLGSDRAALDLFAQLGGELAVRVRREHERGLRAGRHQRALLGLKPRSPACG